VLIQTHTHLLDECTDTAPDVILLQHLGTVEVGLGSISAEELMMHSLANISSNPNWEGGYAVRLRHGRIPVNEFGRANQKPIAGEELNAKPNLGNLSANNLFWLYPYGKGRLEDERLVPVPMSEHVRCNV
jgi:hypothetical protein